MLVLTESYFHSPKKSHINFLKSFLVNIAFGTFILHLVSRMYDIYNIKYCRIFTVEKLQFMREFFFSIIIEERYFLNIYPVGKMALQHFN